jgi:hypothetical protein
MFHAYLAKKIVPEYNIVIASTSNNESMLVIHATRVTAFGQQNFL